MKKLIFAIMCLLWVVQCSAEIIVVEPDGSGDQPTIQAAIDAAYEGDEVVLAIGTYTGDGNRDIDFPGKAITVRSTDPNDPDIVASTIIDCNGSPAEPHRAFYFHSGEDANTILNGLTITNGYAVYGGGIYCEYSRPAITNCTFTGNSAKVGGAIYNCYGRPTVSNCSFSANLAGFDGGAMRNYYSSLTISNCTFSGNLARSRGGAMYNSRSNLTITNCTFSSNSAEGYRPMGGAIHSSNSSLAITNCTFTDSSAEWGGAMYNYRSSQAISNCAFSGNNSAYRGGAIYNYGYSVLGDPPYCNSVITNCTFKGNLAEPGGAMSDYFAFSTITNCTFSGNLASEDGGAMHNNDSNSVITNCILWGDGPQEIFNSDSNPVITYCDVQGGWEGEGNIDIDPCFAEPGFWHPNDTPLDANDDFWVNGDYHLKSQTGRWKPSIYLGLDPTNDGFVDLSDFAAFANSWQKKGSFIPADLNRSGIVDLSDMDLLLDNYLAGYPPGRWVLDDITSPCIDTGDPNYIPEPNETDLDGNPRVAGGIIDMGAYEAPLGPLDLLIELSENIDAMNLHKGTANSLKAKLNAALRLLEDDNVNNDVAVVNLLEAFINAIEAQYDKKIPAADADILIAAAQEIITLLNGE